MIAKRGIPAGRKRAGVLAAVGATALLGGLATAASAGAPSSSEVRRFADQSVAGSSKLVRTDAGIAASINTDGLTPGDAVTTWIVVFNHPEACAASPCTANDRFSEAVDAHAVFGAGHVIGGDGSAGYGLHLSVGDDSREDLWGAGPALTNPQGAEIHLVLRRHGQKQPGNVDDQIHSASLGCNPECVNVQFSVHLPPE